MAEPTFQLTAIRLTWTGKGLKDIEWGFSLAHWQTPLKFTIHIMNYYDIAQFEIKCLILVNKKERVSASEWSSQTDWLRLMDWNSIVHTLLWGLNLRNQSFPLTLGLHREKGRHTCIIIMQLTLTFTFAWHVWFKICPGFSSELQWDHLNKAPWRKALYLALQQSQICWGHICNLATSHQFYSDEGVRHHTASEKGRSRIIIGNHIGMMAIECKGETT